jgi:polar amino acid transport system substrate-binding protein
MLRSISLLVLCLTLPNMAVPCQLRVGWEEWFPLIHRQDDQLTGSEYQLMQELATAAGCTLIFVETPWVRALQLLKSGQLDMLYGASRSAEREAYAQFSQPYRYEQMVLVVRAPQEQPQQPMHELSLADWLAEPRSNGQRRVLGLIRGFNYGTLEPLVRPQAAPTRHLEVRWDQQLHQLLAAQRIDGYLVEMSVARAQQAVGGQPVRLRTVSEQPHEPMYLMFSRDVPHQVVESFNEAILARTRQAR